MYNYKALADRQYYDISYLKLLLTLLTAPNYQQLVLAHEETFSLPVLWRAKIRGPS